MDGNATTFDMTNVLNSLIGTVGAVEINRQNATTPAIAQTANTPAPGVVRKDNTAMYMVAGGAVLVIALYLALK